MSVKPVFTGVQLSPLSAERNTPSLAVPANRFVPEMDSDKTLDHVKSVFTVFQLVPLSVERKTPLPLVPTNRVVPETA